MSSAFIKLSFLEQDTIHAAQVSAYTATTEFIKSNAATLGLDPTTPPESVDEVSIELLNSLSPDPLTFTKPAPLLPSKLTFTLYNDMVPKTVENFLRLCDGTKGIGKQSKKPLYYKDNKVHRIVEGYIVQWGDIVKGDGSSGDSIYGGKFNDEPQGLKIPISRGSLVMANSGKHSNTSQVFVVLSRDSERIKKNMQGKHVVLGHVVGTREEDDLKSDEAHEGVLVLERLDAIKEDTALVVGDCGVL
ncbi:UNVERIFIED_CONTAM: hypothetical protein HDU68_005966 [Siphonaria sp. JEL0065]|nr:hypothetical protein HDU68_005966 [Siphonaria sp. JEL0065]